MTIQLSKGFDEDVAFLNTCSELFTYGIKTRFNKLCDIKCGKSEYIIVPAGTFDKNALLDMSWASKSIPMYYHAASKTGIYTLYKRNKR